MAELNLGSDAECPGYILHPPVAYSGTLLHYGIVACSGVLAFIATGTNKHIYLFWATLFSCAWKGEWKQVLKLITLDNKQLVSPLSAPLPSILSSSLSSAPFITPRTPPSSSTRPKESSAALSSPELELSPKTRPTSGSMVVDTRYEENKRNENSSTPLSLQDSQTNLTLQDSQTST